MRLRGRLVAAVWLFALYLCATAPAARATGNDFQLWPAVRVQHGISQNWAVALTGRIRWDDDLAHRKDALLRPYVTWTPVESIPFIDSLSLMAGYDYLKVNDGRDEHRAWQAVHHTPRRAPLGFVHRARMDERWIHGLDKVIWRFRYRLTTTQQILETGWFARVSDEVLVNLNDEKKGPVGGFEGNRARFGFGSYLTDRLRFEAGYQFEFTRVRSRENEFRHSIYLELVLATGKIRGFEHRKEAPDSATGPGH